MGELSLIWDIGLYPWNASFRVAISTGVGENMSKCESNAGLSYEHFDEHFDYFLSDWPW